MTFIQDEKRYAQNVQQWPNFVCQILQDPVLAKQKDQRLLVLLQLSFLAAKTFSSDNPTHHWLSF
jgi:hypothetical protein